MPSVKNLAGIRFERLVAVELFGRDRQNRAVWMCKCDCGSEKPVPSRHLVNGVVRSCGCLMKETSSANGKRGGWKLTGAQSHLFNPELTDEERMIRRNVVPLREWRRKIFERDDYTCDICGQRGGALNAHHLDCWSAYPEKRFDEDNGVTLCVKHHKQFHDHMGGPRNPCSREDYQRFKDAMGLISALTVDEGGRDA